MGKLLKQYCLGENCKPAPNDFSEGQLEVVKVMVSTGPHGISNDLLPISLVLDWETE